MSFARFRRVPSVKSSHSACYVQTGNEHEGRARMKQRMIYLDRLKVCLTILVVLHHTAVAYGGAGSWYYYEHGNHSNVNALLTMFTVIDQTFFMGLFFFISGYVTPASYDRHGGLRFVKARLIRFGIPIVFYMLVIAPLLQYISSGYQGTLWTYITNVIFTHPFQGILDFSVGPLWYLEALLLFLLIYTGFRIARAKTQRVKAIQLTSRIIVGYVVVISIANFLVRMAFPVGTTWLNLQLGYFPAYIALFVAGIAASRGNWLPKLTERGAHKWKWAVMVMIVLFPVGMALGGALKGDTAVFMGGLSWQAALYAVLDPLMGLGISYVLLVWFRERWNGEVTKFTRWLAANAYLVYILHPLFVTYVAFAPRCEPWPPLAKFVVVGPTAVMLTFVVSSAIRLIPGVKKVV